MGIIKVCQEPFPPKSIAGTIALRSLQRAYPTPNYLLIESYLLVEPAPHSKLSRELGVSTRDFLTEES